MFLKRLPWLVNRNLCLKIIFLSQYCVPKLYFSFVGFLVENTKKYENTETLAQKLNLRSKLVLIMKTSSSPAQRPLKNAGF